MKNQMEIIAQESKFMGKAEVSAIVKRLATSKRETFSFPSIKFIEVLSEVELKYIGEFSALFYGDIVYVQRDNVHPMVLRDNEIEFQLNQKTLSKYSSEQHYLLPVAATSYLENKKEMW